jgi:hypothetical protein
MIKITHIAGEREGVTRLRIDGRILGKTIDALERAGRAGLEGRWPLLLDFSGVSFVDADGATLVAALVKRGAVVVGASPFVSEILRSSDGATASGPDATDADAPLVARLRGGDERAFDEMTRRYAGRMGGGAAHAPQRGGCPRYRAGGVRLGLQES